MSIVISNKKLEFLKYLLIGCVVSALNTLWVYETSYSYFLVLAELVVLVLCLLQKSVSKYFVYYLLFISPCIEFSSFASSDNVISLKNIRIGGMNLGIVTLLPFLLYFLMNFSNFCSIAKKEQRTLWRFGSSLVAINLIAIFVGVLCLLGNDNGIRKMDGYISLFIGEAYSMLFLPLGILSILITILVREKQYLYRVSYALQAVLMANVVQMIVSVTFGILGSYGKDDWIMASTVFFYSPLMLIFFITSKEIPLRRFTLLLAVVGTLLALRYGANGKLFIATGVVLIAVVWAYWKGMNTWKRLLSIVVIAVVIFGLPVLFGLLARSNTLVEWKLRQATALLAFGKGWLNNLPGSPRVRIEEFVNIFIEFTRKPWFIFTGKGILGTVKDYSGFWGTLTGSTRLGAFSEAEWNCGLFYGMHEITNLILLYGLMGITYAWKSFKYSFRNYRHSVYLIFGMYWLLLFYGFSFILNVFGITAFFYSMINEENISCDIKTEDNE